MTREEAKEYAKNMSYADAIYNLYQAKSISYKKATLIKLKEMADKIKAMENCK